MAAGGAWAYLTRRPYFPAQPTGVIAIGYDPMIFA
ncbi:hypothetical protein QO006_000330 [Deinococcus enclensis]|uniref:Uncharacterized protein n=1 Tax=Deinococcus enclensis TaxID=1049582 RepID=A0ABT9M8K9_9DEIO|nr:hypothetical protein [Deinococcus enclensis]